jgi:hypothetical protein
MRRSWWQVAVAVLVLPIFTLRGRMGADCFQWERPELVESPG